MAVWWRRIRGLVQRRDFALGYRAERINPGDHVHRLETITKIIAADSPAAFARCARSTAPSSMRALHEAPSIKVAEAAKVIENTSVTSILR